MINNERQYNNQNSANVRYKNDYVGIDTENKVAQNAYAYEDENLQTRNNSQTSTATGFDALIEEQNTTAGTAFNRDSDLLPSPTTLQFIGKERSYVYQDLNNRQKHEEDDVNYKINTKSKVMIAVYALVVLTIVTLIILNTRLLKTMDTSINEQEARIEALQQENTNLYSQYQVLSSDEEISRRAEEMGMTKGE